MACGTDESAVTRILLVVDYLQVSRISAHLPTRSAILHNTTSASGTARAQTLTLMKNEVPK